MCKLRVSFVCWFKSGNITSNITADRVDNNEDHHMDMIRHCCRWCNWCRSNKSENTLKGNNLNHNNRNNVLNKSIQLSSNPTSVTSFKGAEHNDISLKPDMSLIKNYIDKTLNVNCELVTKVLINNGYYERLRIHCHTKSDVKEKYLYGQKKEDLHI